VEVLEKFFKGGQEIDFLTLLHVFDSHVFHETHDSEKALH
jgi:hypothetical protein